VGSGSAAWAGHHGVPDDDESKPGSAVWRWGMSSGRVTEDVRLAGRALYNG